MVTLPFIIQLRFLLCGLPFQPLILLSQSCWVLLEHMVLKLTRAPNNLLGGRLQPTTFLSCAWIVSAWYFKQGSSSFPNQVIFLAYSDWHSVLLWFALYHGIGFTADIRCDYPNWRSFDDCWMANLGLECFQIRKIIGM